MKNYIIYLLIIALIASCKCDNVTSNASDGGSEIIGTWRMVYAEIKEGDSLQIKDMGKSEFVKIINETHFAFFNQDLTDASLFYGGGGEYTLEGDQYTETLHFTSVDEVRDHQFLFTIEVKNDTLIQHGLEEVKEANIKRHIVEKYIRIKK